MTRFLARFAYWHELVLAMLVVGLFITASQLSPHFTDLHVQRELSKDVWSIAILALPMTMIIITGGIDLSVGSLVALSAVIAARLIRDYGGASEASFVAP
jgi:ribose transport system permease protein